MLKKHNIKVLLDAVEINAQSQEKLKLLIDSLIKLDYKKFLIDKTSDVSPLIYYTVNHGELLTLLLEHFKDFDINDNIFINPVHIEDTVGNSLFDETKHGNSNLIKLVNWLDDCHKSALSYAMEQKMYHIACTLLLHGANLDHISVVQQRKLLLYAAKEVLNVRSYEYHQFRPVVGLL